MSFKLGLIGAPGAGKDTLADFLIKNNNFKKLAFADQIKKEYYQEFGFTEEYFKSVRGTSEEQKIRDGLWKYSDEMRNKHGKLHFIRPIIDEVKSSSEDIVVTDIRTKDEFEQMNSAQAYILLVIRDLKLENNIIFPGTRLKFRELMGIPVFWNYSDNLETAYREFEIFFKDIILKTF